MEQETMTLGNTPEIKKAYKELERLSINPKFRMEYEFWLKYLNDCVWELSESHEEGREEGVTKGLKEGVDLGKELVQKEKARLALSLSNDGMDKKKIASLIGISLEELKNILLQDGSDSTDIPGN